MTTTAAATKARDTGWTGFSFGERSRSPAGDFVDTSASELARGGVTSSSNASSTIGSSRITGVSGSDSGFSTTTGSRRIGSSRAAAFPAGFLFGTPEDGSSSSLGSATTTAPGAGSSMSRFFAMASCNRATNSEACESRSLGSSENAAAKAARNFPASMPGMVVNNRVSWGAGRGRRRRSGRPCACRSARLVSCSGSRGVPMRSSSVIAASE